MGRRWRFAVGAAVTVVAAWAGVLRRPMLRWGATERECAERLPGDDVVPNPALRSTRATDVGAPPSQVWPWIVQLGYGPGRGGFYSYDWLENLIGLDIHSADSASPVAEPVTVGQQIPFGPDTFFRVEQVEPGTSLVLHVRMHPFTGVDVMDRPSPLWLDWTWAFVVRGRADGARLVVRTRGTLSPRWLGWLYLPVLEPVHLVMERRMLLGLKERAELRQPH